jgi:sulfite exporter TauE/SafE
MELDFEKNLGDTDRVIRVVLGAALIWLAILHYISGVWAALAWVFGVSQFIEAAFSY